MPSPELVDLVQEDVGPPALLKWSLPDRFGVPGQSAAKSCRLFPQEFQVEAHEEDVGRWDTLAQEILDDLLDARGLANLTGSADNFDQPLGAPKAAEEFDK
jgi:hypothetical protein